MRRKAIQFDTRKAIQAAWDMIWVHKLAQRAKDEKEFKKTGHERYRTGDTYYTTAADVENQVRRFASEQLRGEPWGASGLAFGRDYAGVRMSGRLQGAVRDFLLHNSKITGHNFGRGHISGMRFRPVGQPLAPAEQKTIAKKEERRANPRPKLYHLSRHGRPLCVNRKTHGWRPSKAWMTHDKNHVTCPRCRSHEDFAAVDVSKEIA